MLDGPQDRADFEDQSPPILVESPVFGDVVTSPLQLQGTANTFEANFEYEVLAPDGTKLAGTFVTATCGTGCRGTFDEQVIFDAGDADAITLVVLERSAEDGSRTNEVRIPLDLGRRGQVIGRRRASRLADGGAGKIGHVSDPGAEQRARLTRPETDAEGTRRCGF